MHDELLESDVQRRIFFLLGPDFLMALALLVTVGALTVLVGRMRAPRLRLLLSERYSLLLASYGLGHVYKVSESKCGNSGASCSCPLPS